MNGAGDAARAKLFRGALQHDEECVTSHRMNTVQRDRRADLRDKSREKTTSRAECSDGNGPNIDCGWRDTSCA
jgi:hypothetical protein